MTDEELKQLLEDVSEIKGLLKGYNGRRGLVEQIEVNTKAINKLWIAIFIMAASTGSGVFAIVKTLVG